MNGWVKLHRQLLDNEFLASDQTAFVLFIKLLLFVRDDGSCTLGRQQIERLFGIKGTTAYKAIKRLEKEKMVTTSVTGKYTKINILNWGKYQQAGNRSSNRSVTSGEQVGNRSVTLNKNKNIKLENTTNVVLDKSSYGNTEINEMFNYWQNRVGYEISGKRQANRNACNNLLKKHGADKVKRLIDGVSISQNDRYAPRIADFVQLQSKLSELMAWGKQQTKSIRGVQL